MGIFITVFVLLIMVLAPIFIMPLFHKYEPIEENLLKQDICALAEECKYPVSKIEVCDGSKKSGHSNAFQYGFGKIKKIVLFDTLLDQHLGKANGEKKEKDKHTDGPLSKSCKEGNESSESDDNNQTESEVEDKKKVEDVNVLKQSEFDYENRKGRYEILGIVAHELGHWANMDTFKLLTFSLVRIYLIFFLFSFSMKYTDMPHDFGFSEQSVFLSLILFF